MDIGKIFKEKYPTFKRYAYTWVRNEAAAQDVVMDVFVKLVERNESGTLPAVITNAYITMAIRNRAVDVHRKNQALEPMGVNQEQVLDENSDKQVYANANLDEIIQKLEMLGEMCKDILSLFGLGYSYQEISEIEETELGTVMSRMARCRTKLISEYR